MDSQSKPVLAKAGIGNEEFEENSILDSSDIMNNSIKLSNLSFKLI